MSSATNAPKSIRPALLKLAVMTGSALLTFSAFEAGIFDPSYNKVEAAVAQQLRDPDSAQFRNIIGSDDAYCGEVNAKNGFGAYTGFRKFVYRRGVVLFQPEEPMTSNVSQMADYYEDVVRFLDWQEACSD